MLFPFYHAPYVGNGIVIAINAVVHVLVSHGVAIGAVLMLWIADRHAQRTNVPGWRIFSKRFLKFTVITVTVVGAVTGAGIWFTTITLVPSGIASMLHVFFWPWFVEWGVFVLEAVVLLLLYFNWERWGKRAGAGRTLALVFYFVLVFASAFLITGILGFMLTSGAWPAEGGFWRAFLNPSFGPQLLLRLSLAVALGAILALAFVAFGHRELVFRADASYPFATVLLVAMLSAGLSLLWYAVAVPPAFLSRTEFALLTSNLSQWPWVLYAANAVALAVLAGLSIAVLARRVRWTRWLVVPAALAVVGFFVQFERAREFNRGPFLMPGYMYANGISLQESALYERTGLLADDAWHRRIFPAGVSNQKAAPTGRTRPHKATSSMSVSA